MSSDQFGSRPSYPIQHGHQIGQQQQQQHHQQHSQYQTYSQMPQQSQMQAPRFYKNTEQVSNSDSSNVYLALLGLAESFQQAGKYNLSIHCLESMFAMMKQDKQLPSFHFQLKVRFNLCRLYLRYTVGTNEAVNVHLEKSVSISLKQPSQLSHFEILIAILRIDFAVKKS